LPALILDNNSFMLGQINLKQPIHNPSRKSSHTLSQGKPPNGGEDPTICSALALLELIERTKDWRTDKAKKDALFLTSTNPHTPAAVDNIVLANKYTDHHRSTSKSEGYIRAISVYLAGADTTRSHPSGTGDQHIFYQRGIKK
ncbi:20969_t:CDS:2, partial [Gigaspora rosea]